MLSKKKKEVKRSSQVHRNIQEQEKKQSAHKNAHSGHATSKATFSHHACIFHMLIPMTSNAIKLFLEQKQYQKMQARKRPHNANSNVRVLKKKSPNFAGFYHF